MGETLLAYKVFDRNVERYDAWYLRHEEIFKCEAKLLRSLKLRGEGLSIGVGTGILDVEAGVRIGIDPSINMLKLARKRGVETILSVGERLPFRSGIFDYVLMSVTLCFLTAPKPVLKEAYRVLKAEGEIAVCFIPRDSAWGEAYMEKARRGHPFYKHARFYTLEEVKRLLEECSFKVTTVKGTLSYPPNVKPKIEEPAEDVEGKGFICVKAVKV